VSRAVAIHTQYPHITLSQNLAESSGADLDEVTRVSDVLDDLQKFDERAARVIAMRYWAGMTDSEIAAAMGVTDRTVLRL